MATTAEIFRDDKMFEKFCEDLAQKLAKSVNEGEEIAVTVTEAFTLLYFQQHAAAVSVGIKALNINKAVAIVSHEAMFKSMNDLVPNWLEIVGMADRVK